MKRIENMHTSLLLFARMCGGTTRFDNILLQNTILNN